MPANSSEQLGQTPQDRDAYFEKLKIDVEAINYDKSLSFEHNLDRRLRFYAQKVEEVLKKDNQLGQVGEDQMNAMVTRQVEGLRQIYLAKLNEFKGLMDSQRQERAKAIFENVEADAGTYFKQLNGIVADVVGDKPLEAEQADHLKAILTGVATLRKAPETIKIFDKLSNHQNLEDEDFKHLVKLMNPGEIKQKSLEIEDAAKSFEASQVGTILVLMKPEDRVKTLEYVAKLKPEEAVNIIEALTAASVVSVTQVQDLLNKNLLPTKQRAELEEKIQSGDLAKMHQLTEENFKRRSRRFNDNYARNVMNVIVGKPLLYGIGAVWGSAIAAANVAADFDYEGVKQKRVGWGDIAKNMATNPYLIGSSLATAYAAHKLAPHLGGMFPEVDATGKKIVQGAKDIFGPSKLTPKEQQEHDRHATKLLWNNLRNNVALQNFLLEGKKGETGYDLLMKIRSEKLKARQTQGELPDEEKTSILLIHEDISISKLLSPHQKELFHQALNANINPIFFNSEINSTLVASNQLNIHDGEEFKTAYEIIKKQEGGIR